MKLARPIYITALLAFITWLQVPDLSGAIPIRIGFIVEKCSFKDGLGGWSHYKGLTGSEKAMFKLWARVVVSDLSLVFPNNVYFESPSEIDPSLVDAMGYITLIYEHPTLGFGKSVTGIEIRIVNSNQIVLLRDKVSRKTDIEEVSENLRKRLMLKSGDINARLEPQTQLKSKAQTFKEINLPSLQGRKIKLAVVDLIGYTLSPAEVSTLTQKVKTVLAKTDYFDLISTSDMQEILKAQDFQASGRCDETQCLVEMGKILAVEKIATGTIGIVGKKYSLSLRMVDIETARIEHEVDLDIECKVEDLLDVFRHLSLSLSLEYAKVQKSS